MKPVLQRLRRTLLVPAAEYVPAITDALDIIDAALSLPDPLREIECPPDPDAVDRALATEGVCAFCGGIVSDPLVRPSAAPVVPQGWKLVPEEPTREMFAAAGAVDDLAFAHGSSHGADIATLWEVMCAAAPPAPQQGEQAGQEGAQG